MRHADSAGCNAGAQGFRILVYEMICPEINASIERLQKNVLEIMAYCKTKNPESRRKGLSQDGRKSTAFSECSARGYAEHSEKVFWGPTFFTLSAADRNATPVLRHSFKRTAGFLNLELTALATTLWDGQLPRPSRSVTMVADKQNMTLPEVHF